MSLGGIAGWRASASFQSQLLRNLLMYRVETYTSLRLVEAAGPLPFR
jgi:hypothetical protein